MAWRISSPYQALQLVDITLPSVFFECLFLVSQRKHFFLHDHYSYHKFLFLFSYIPPLYSQVLDIQQVFPFVFFSSDANSSSAGVLVNGESHLSVSPVIEVRENKNCDRLLDPFTTQ